PRKARAPADLAGRIDAERLQETQIFDVDPEGRLLGNSPAAVVGLGRRLPPPRPGARRAAIDADLRVENHVEVVSLVADALDGVVHATRARDGLIDRLPQLLQHLAKMIVQFHGRGDYRLRFREASRRIRRRVHAMLTYLAQRVPARKSVSMSR